MPIELPELRGIDAGIYAISPTKPKKGKISYKVGRSIHLKNRMNGYHICFNRGYYIYVLLPLKKNKFKNNKERLAFTKILEKELFVLLRPYNELYTTRKRKSEWFGLTSKKLKEIFEEINARFSDKTDPPITKWKELGYVHKFEVDGEDIDTQAEPLSYLPQKAQVSKRGRRIKPKKFKDFVYIR